MKLKIGLAIGVLGIALLAVAVYGTTAVLADDGGPDRPTQGHGGRGLDGHRLDGAALEAAAGALGMSPEDLSAALEGGKTLPELAEQAGVDMEQVSEAMQAVRAESMRERIEQALEEGTITQEHADWLLEGLEAGYLDGPHFGFGGHFEKGAPPAAPAE